MSERASGGRLTVYAIGGALAGIVPLPIIPRRVLRIIRGAMAHDVCAHHGIAMTPEARDILSDTAQADRKGGGLTEDALTFVGTRLLRRFTPLGAVYAPLRNAWETMTFGHLLDRYLEKHRVDPGLGKRSRMEVEEAIAIRRMLDRAAMRAFRHSIPTDETDALALEEHRDPIERVLDGLLISAASLPDAVVRRLDLALDALVAEARA